MLTQILTMELDLPDSISKMHQAILNELRKHGTPLNWIVVDVDVNRQKAVVDALIHIEE
jgi:outer membrane protein assembly factor BamA